METMNKLRSFLEQIQDGISADAKKGILRFSPDQFDEAGRILFENLKKGGFATFLVPGRTGWDPESVYYEAARKQARAGKNITRLFLLPHRHYMRETRLRRHWELDYEAGINVKFSIVDGSLLSGLLLLPETLDFGIWDDEIVCWVYKQSFSSSRATGSFVTTDRQEHIELANRIKDSLLIQEVESINSGLELDEFALEEPLVKSAPTMALLSDFLCEGDHVNYQDCGWYHASWQYLRLLDLVSTPTWHSAFFLGALKFSIRKDHECRVLISGAADYSMLAYVIHVFNQLNAKCDISVIDLCETPLMICKWYANTKKIDITTYKQDILNFSTPNLFDCVITDAFLTRFQHDYQVKVLRKWNQLLKNGGNVITTIRIDPNVVLNKPIRPTPQEIRDFVHRAEVLANLWREFVLLEPEEIGNLAGIYAQRIESYPIPDNIYLTKLFTDAGYEIQNIAENTIKGEMNKTNYAEIVAKKTC